MISLCILANGLTDESAEARDASGAFLSAFAISHIHTADALKQPRATEGRITAIHHVKCQTLTRLDEMQSEWMTEMYVSRCKSSHLAFDSSVCFSWQLLCHRGTVWQGRIEGIHFKRGVRQTKTRGRGRVVDRDMWHLLSGQNGNYYSVLRQAWNTYQQCFMWMWKCPDSLTQTNLYSLKTLSFKDRETIGGGDCISILNKLIHF